MYYSPVPTDCDNNFADIDEFSRSSSEMEQVETSRKFTMEERAEILQPLLFTTLLGPLNSRLKIGRPRLVFADASAELVKAVSFAEGRVVRLDKVNSGF